MLCADDVATEELALQIHISKTPIWEAKVTTQMQAISISCFLSLAHQFLMD